MRLHSGLQSFTLTLLLSPLSMASNTHAAPQHCAPPKHFSGARYRLHKGKIPGLSKDQEDERNLCSLDPLIAQGPDSIGVCPKTYATNPGLIYYGLPKAETKQAFEKANCQAGPKKPKKVAKFKVTLPDACSSTPTILASYHLSRILGDILHVPVAIPMQIETAYFLGKTEIAARDTGKTPTNVQKNWATLTRILGPKGEPWEQELVLTSDKKQVHGALLKVMTKETLFNEAGFNENDGTFAAMKEKNPHYRMLLDKRPLTALIPGTFDRGPVQDLVTMKDLGDMLIFDFLLNQQDRIGNIHMLKYRYWIDPTALPKSALVLRAPSGGKAPRFLKNAKFIEINEIALKDNDCGGPLFKNLTREENLLAAIAHLSPETYQRVLWFRSLVDKSDTENYFKNELRFQDRDWKTLKDNVVALSDLLKQRCEKGELRLDLTLSHFTPPRPPSPPVDCSNSRDFSLSTSDERSDF